MTDVRWFKEKMVRASRSKRCLNSRCSPKVLRESDGHGGGGSHDLAGAHGALLNHESLSGTATRRRSTSELRWRTSPSTTKQPQKSHGPKLRRSNECP